MLKFKVTGVNIQADVNQGGMTSVTLHALVASDRRSGTAEELEKIARAVGVLCATDLDDVPRPEDVTVEEGTDIIYDGEYLDSQTYGETMADLQRSIVPFETIKHLSLDNRSVLLAVRDWLNEVTQ